MPTKTLYQRLVLLGAVAACLTCQNYGFVFQPDQSHGGLHLNFTVQTPSKADLLFVIDNSGSMANKQLALSQSITQMLAVLTPQSASYRIGIVSTDAFGSLRDCAGAQNPAVLSNNFSDASLGAKGNCSRPTVLLQRPHDGTLGRLLAAYDPQAFDPNNFAKLGTLARAAVSKLLPVQMGSTVQWPVGQNGLSGPRWVIDHDETVADACGACGCSSCVQSPNNTCYSACAAPAAQALIEAYFRSNISGLGTSGFGWEQGLLSALWAVGIDPQDSNDTAALNPAYNLLAPGAPNTHQAVAGAAGPQSSSWLRDDAQLAVMFVTDEQDCSMPTSLMTLRTAYEVGKPVSSICYQAQPQTAFLDTTRMARLLTAAKGNSAARVAVGFIGGVSRASSGANATLFAQPSDCAVTAGGSPQPSAACTCLATQDNSGAPDPGWCGFTKVPSNPSDPANPLRSMAACSALGGSRYVAFANNFTRRTYESICRNDVATDGSPIAFGPALQDFAHLATLPCFDLKGLRPFQNDAKNIVLKRAAYGSGLAPSPLPMTDSSATTPGWFYNPVDNQVCLTGLPRLVGDVYDLFVYTTSSVDYRN
jgi:hypothetical protein